MKSCHKLYCGVQSIGIDWALVTTLKEIGFFITFLYGFIKNPSGVWLSSPLIAILFTPTNQNEITITDSGVVSQPILSEPTMDKADTTVFRNESREASVSLSSHPANTLLRDVGTSLSSFLAKPYLITHGDWSTGDAAKTIRESFTLGSQLTSNPYWASKVQGFENIRGTAVVRVLLNANPFQAGLLKLTFDPSHPFVNSQYRYNNLAAISQMPGVEINCRDGSGMMRIPYTSVSDYYNLKSGLYDWGIVKLIVMSSLVTGAGGETTVGYSIYLSFEDVEIASPLVPQSGRVTTSKRKIKSIAATEASAIASTGTISAVFENAGSLLTSIGKAVPSASAFTAPAAWIASAAAGVASYFGYSKPVHDGHPNVVSQLKIPYMASSSGVSTASVLALRHDNAISINDYSPTPYDEMSWDYIKQIPSIVQVVQLSTSDVWNQNKLVFSLFPGNSSITTTTTDNFGNNLRLKYLCPGGFVSRYFRFWRGSIKIRFKFIKTDFHNGRYMITFTPTTTGSSSPSATTSVLSIREIIDLAGPDEIELTFPYLMPFPWINRQSASTTSMGFINIICLNPLRAPETASSTVDVLLYMSLGCDFEVMGPQDINAGSVNMAALPAIVAQSGYQTDPSTNKIADSLAGTIGACSNDNTLAPSQAGGEVFNSLKQLTSKYSNIIGNGSQLVTDATGHFYFATHYFGMPYQNSLAVFQPTAFAGDVTSEIAGMFAFFRGSTRFAITMDSAESSKPITTSLANISTAQDPYAAGWSGANYSLTSESIGASGSYPVPYRTMAPSNSITQVHNASVGLAEVQAPYYNSFKLSPVQTRMNTIPETCPTSVVLCRVSTAAPVNVWVSRATAEDFKFTYFLSAPGIFDNY